MITGDEIVEAIDQHRAIQDLFTDPDLTDRLLLIAIAFRTRVIGKRFTKAHTWLDELAEVTGLRPLTIQLAIGRDVPRYQPPSPGFDALCDAPMIRRAGPCGQRASRHGSDIDPTTGEEHPIGRCSRHDDRSVWLARDAHLKEWIANGKPRPPHNAGGLLARHFPSDDWPKVYAWAAPHIEQTPGEGKPPTPRPPKLTLIRGGLQ